MAAVGFTPTIGQQGSSQTAVSSAAQADGPDLHQAAELARRQAQERSEYQADIDFREAFGLRSDIAHIESIRSRQDVEPLEATYGIALLPDEERAVNVQTARQASLTAAKSQLADSVGEGYAGVTIDQTRGGVVELHVNATVTRSDLDLLADVRSLLDEPEAPVEVARVEYDLGTLKASYDAVLARLNSLDDGGLDTSSTSVGVDLRRNRVYIMGPEDVTQQVESSLAEARGSIAAGSVVARVDQGTSGLTTDRGDEDPPIRGGMRIDVGESCTAGAPLIRLQHEVTGEFMEWNALTAGHCVDNNLGDEAHWNPPFSSVWGLNATEVFHDNSFADAGLTRYYTAFPQNIPGCNKFYVTATLSRCYGSAVTSNPVQGSVLQGSNGISGNLTANVLDEYFSGRQCDADGTSCAFIEGQVKISAVTQPGDSGSPWHLPGDSPRFVGIATALYVEVTDGGIRILGSTLSTWPKIQMQYNDVDNYAFDRVFG